MSITRQSKIDPFIKIREFMQSELYKELAAQEEEEVMIAVLARRLKEIRKAKRLTQKQLAEKLGANQSQIARWETAKDVPNVKTLLRICKTLNSKLEIIY